VGDAGLAAKTAAVAAALAANAALIREGGALGALRAVGGLELAAMVGAFLEAGRRRLPVVVDGFISGAAALAAARHDSSILPSLFASHASAEAGAGAVLEALGLRAPLHMDMRLGEVQGLLGVSGGFSMCWTGEEGRAACTGLFGHFRPSACAFQAQRLGISGPALCGRRYRP
jgi:hypothetical protein